MTDLILVGYSLSALICVFSSCALIARGKEKGSVAVGIVLTNTLITFMLIYGALHT